MSNHTSTLPDPNPPQLPAGDSGEAGAAYVLSMALGRMTMTPTAALDEQRRRVQALRDPTAPAALDELARQLPLLEALFHRLAAEALCAPTVDSRARLVRAALQAQSAQARLIALVQGLALQRQGAARVAVDLDDDDSDSDAHAHSERWQP
jgi:hypothetical protein